jgi:hypothetical protein
MTKIQQQGPARQASPSSQDKSASLSACGRVWAKIGILSFGGPAAQIALMHREIVAERGWLTDRQFSDALSFCMLLPGPEAMQLAMQDINFVRLTRARNLLICARLLGATTWNFSRRLSRK